jgi:hypothetical protein
VERAAAGNGITSESDSQPVFRYLARPKWHLDVDQHERTSMCGVKSCGHLPGFPHTHQNWSVLPNTSSESSECWRKFNLISSLGASERLSGPMRL